MECATWLADAQVPFSLVFTKTDKRKKDLPSPKQNMEAFEVSLCLCAYPLTPFCGSSAQECYSGCVLPTLAQTLGSAGVLDLDHVCEGSLPWQAALLRDFENLPPVFATDSVTQKGQLELLSHVAQHRILQAGR